MYKIKLLKQVDYFNDEVLDQEFFYDVHLHLVDQFFEAKGEIISANEVCDLLIFIASGEVEV